MNEIKIKKQRKIRRQARVRKKLAIQNGLRLSVFRSNKHFYAQLIDLATGNVVLSVHEKELEKKDLTKTQKAEQLGALIASRAASKKIGRVMFDRSSYKYHGRVKAFAEGARSGGLQF